MLIPSSDLATFSLGSLNNGLILGAPFDDTTGLTADISGNGYEGTVDGATRGQVGYLGNSFSFDGVNDAVNFEQAGLVSDLNGLSSFAIAIWAAAPAFVLDECAISIRDNGDFDSLGLYPYYAGGNVNLWMDSGTVMSVTNPAPADGSFHLIILNQTAVDAREIFVDAVSAGTDTSTHSLMATLDGVTVGAFGTIEEFEGNIDSPRIWNRSLTAEERVRLQNER